MDRSPSLPQLRGGVGAKGKGTVAFDPVNDPIRGVFHPYFVAVGLNEPAEGGQGGASWTLSDTGWGAEGVANNTGPPK